MSSHPQAANKTLNGYADPYFGKTIGGRYVIDAVIGQGGMGRVYRAHHRLMGKPLAIKVLHAELAQEKEHVDRFVREAIAASSVGNEHIVDVTDFGTLPDGATYFVMEYLEGHTLADRIGEQGPLPAPLVCEIGRQLCDGLAAAHAQQSYPHHQTKGRVDSRR